MNNLPYNHDMRESLLQKSLFSLSRYLKLCKSPHAGPSLCQEYCMPVGRKKKNALGGRNQFAHLKELVDQCQWGWRILAVTAKSRVSQGPLSEQLLTVHLSSRLPLEDGPSPPPAPLFYRSEHWAALRDPSCPCKFSWTAPSPGMLRVTTCCSDSLVAGIWKMQHRNTAFVAAGQATRFFKADNQTPT